MGDSVGPEALVCMALAAAGCICLNCSGFARTGDLSSSESESPSAGLSIIARSVDGVSNAESRALTEPRRTTSSADSRPALLAFVASSAAFVEIN